MYTVKRSEREPYAQGITTPVPGELGHAHVRYTPSDFCDIFKGSDSIHLKGSRFDTLTLNRIEGNVH